MRSRLRGEEPGPRRLWEGDGRADHVSAAQGVGREGWSGKAEGQQVNHLDLMHGRDYAAGQRIAGWLVQEKFNGLRCLWTGTQLVSRNGERFNAPAWFTAGLPSVPLDGELYAGHRSLGRISNTLARHKSGKDEDWKRVWFMVFDAPAASGGYLERMSSFKLPSLQLGRAVPVPEFRREPWSTRGPEGLAELRRDLKHLHKSGGEGFILRDPSAPYVAGRTATVLKFKARSLY